MFSWRAGTWLLVLIAAVLLFAGSGDVRSKEPRGGTGEPVRVTLLPGTTESFSLTVGNAEHVRKLNLSLDSVLVTQAPDIGCKKGPWFGVDHAASDATTLVVTVTAAAERCEGTYRGMLALRPRPNEQAYRNKYPSPSDFPITIVVEPLVPPPPTARVMEPQIFVRDQGKARFEDVVFDVPVGGPATLRLVNGAKLGAERPDRVTGATIRLNGRPVAGAGDLKKKLNLLNVPVELLAGENRLSVQVRGGRGTRLAARIEAVADAITLEPVLNAIVIGGDPLRAQATVSALGVPVPDAEVRFEVRDLDDLPDVLVETNGAGIALAQIGGFQAPGSGWLSASAVGIDEVEIPIEVVRKQTLTVVPGASSLSIEAGGGRVVPFSINLSRENTSTYHVTVDYAVDPADGGITVTPVPSDTVEIPAPNTTSTSQLAIGGVIAGKYALTATATVNETGETYSAGLSVEVTDPDHLSLDRPFSDPDGIIAGETTEVVFRVRTSEVRFPPEVVLLRDLDAPKQPPAEMHDDGLAPDLKVGDGVYAVAIDVGNDEEIVKRYQASAPYGSETAVSEIYTLPVTKFPICVAELPTDPASTVEDLKNGGRFVNNRVLLTFFPGVGFNRIRGIVADENGEVLCYQPTLQIYQVEVPRTASFTALVSAVDGFAAYAEVDIAAPEPVGDRPGTANDPCFDDGDGFSNPYCVIAGTEYDPEYLRIIHADGAWDHPLVTSADPIVAVIDSGLETGHPEFQNVRIHSDSRHVTCDPADNPGSTCADTNIGDTLSDRHGTRVAGIIAAKKNNGAGIAGIAADALIGTAASAELLVYRVDTGLVANMAALVRAKQAANAASRKLVVNFSTAWANLTSTNVVLLENKLRNVVFNDQKSRQNILVVTPSNQFAENLVPHISYPAIYAGDNNVNVMAVAAINGNGHDGSPVYNRLNYLDDGAVVSSNYATGANGDWVTLTAPGKNIISTANGGYAIDSGTSFAAPQVAGAAALIWSAFPNLTAGEVREKLVNINNVTPIGNGSACSGNADPADLVCNEVTLPNHQTVHRFGAGLLNVQAAINANRPPTNITLSNASVPEGVPGATVGTLAATDPDDSSTPFGQHVFTVSDTRFQVLGTQLKLKPTRSLAYGSDPTITVTAADNPGGPPLTVDKSFTIAVTSVPTVSITAPSPQTYPTAQTVDIVASASSGAGVQKVEFYDGGVKAGEDANQPYSFSWAFNRPDNGPHSWTAKVIDNDGNSKTSTPVALTVTIADTTAPTVSITGPASGSTYPTPQTVTITATANDDPNGDGMARVDFYDGTTLQGTDPSAPYTHSWAVNDANNGSHQWTAKAVDKAGNSRTSSVVTLNVSIPVRRSVELPVERSGDASFAHVANPSFPPYGSFSFTFGPDTITFQLPPFDLSLGTLERAVFKFNGGERFPAYSAAMVGPGSYSGTVSYTTLLRAGVAGGQGIEIELDSYSGLAPRCTSSTLPSDIGCRISPLTQVTSYDGFTLQLPLGATSVTLTLTTSVEGTHTVTGSPSGNYSIGGSYSMDGGASLTYEYLAND